jgi:Domain of unknown function (DUF397)
MDQLEGAQWRKSSYSGGNGGNCVEVAGNLPGIVAVRDSKDRGGPRLAVTDRTWTVFVREVRQGDFDLA